MKILETRQGLNLPFHRLMTLSEHCIENVCANIKVVVRVRPINEKETESKYKSVVKVENDNILIFDPEEECEPFFYHGIIQTRRDLLRRYNKNMRFHFDCIFPDNSQNVDIFGKTTQVLIDSLMEGCNCSVFAYGATGAGKTYTMLGQNCNPGITLLTMQDLFQRKQELSEERDFEIGVTYLEVYNESVRDLLNPGPSLHLREDEKYGVVIAGMKMKLITAPGELLSLLERGNQNRAQHSTNGNAESSRSHAVFQVYIRMKMKKNNRILAAKLSMIDLAGSERGTTTGCGNVRFTEGSNINRSLLALGNCINGLADGNKYIPYRDSKLTRLLKDSLGGNCRTIMIANISPSSLSYEDTYNTLKYATRAKKIRLNLKTNVTYSDMGIDHYSNIIEDLQHEVKKLTMELNQERRLNVYKFISHEVREKLTIVLNERYTLYKNILELKQEMKLLKSEVNDTTVNFIQADILSLQNRINVLDTLAEEMVMDSSDFQQIMEMENERMKKLEFDHQVQDMMHINKKLSDELKCTRSSFEKLIYLLHTCYDTLQCHRLVSNNLCKDYQSVFDDICDSGISSVSDFTSTGSKQSINSSGFDSKTEKKNSMCVNALLVRSDVIKLSVNVIIEQVLHELFSCAMLNVNLYSK